MTALPTSVGGSVRDRSRQAFADTALWFRADPWTTAVLAVAFVAGLVVRVVHVNSVGLNSDEAVYSGQAASIDNNSDFTPYFPVFRAHPLLFQAVLSVVYRFGVSDLTGRLLSVAVGMATVWLTFVLGRILYNARVGAVAALLLAVMPYAVVVSRQILLDGPMTLAATAALVCLAKFDRTREPRWILVASGAMALTVLTKETSIVLVASAYLYLGLIAAHRRAWTTAAIGLVMIVGLAALHPLVLAIVHHTGTGNSYLAWQLSRPSNHTLWFYARTVPPAMGPLVIATALAGLADRRSRTSREVLLISWAAVPTVFFTIWPIKGFQYLVPVAPAVAVLAGSALMRCTVSWVRQRNRAAARIGIIAVATASILIPTALRIDGRSATALAGSGGLPGGREVGHWIEAHVPQGARLMTIGPSMANVIEWYGDRECRALSVSTNPLHRNPVYEPILNPDLALRTFDYQYIVWDAFSAHRSEHFAAVTKDLIRKYHGRVVHVQTLHGSGQPGSGTPIIVIYQVHP